VRRAIGGTTTEYHKEARDPARVSCNKRENNREGAKDAKEDRKKIGHKEAQKSQKRTVLLFAPFCG
jgi:hypothetical protein